MAGLRTIAVARETAAREAFGETLASGGAVRQKIEAAHDAAASEGDQTDRAPLAGRPALGITRGNIEVHAPRLGAIEHQAAVYLEERIVRADEDRVIGRVLDLDLDGPSARVERDRPFAEQDFAGSHRRRSR